MSWLLAACSNGPRQLLQLLKEVIDQEYSGGLLVGSALALAVNVVYTLAAKALHQRMMVARFLYDTPERLIRAPRHVIDRSSLIDQVRHVLTQGTAYYSIVGPKGSGKSWVVQQAAAKVPGCLYISLPANLTEEDFVTLLAETFSFRFERHLSWAEVLLEKLFGSSEAPENEMSHFLRVTEAVEETAVSAGRQLGYSPSLILDNCGYIPPETLGKLHDWAYDCASRGVLRLVFVMAQNPVFGSVLKRPATFRMELLYVEDIRREDAILFLQQASGVDEVEAADLVDNYLGCRLLELEKACYRLNFPTSLYGDPAKNVRWWTLQRVVEVLRQLGLAYVLCGHNPDLDVNGYFVWTALLHLADTRAPMPWEEFVSMVTAEVARTHAHFPALFRFDAAGHVVIDPALATTVRQLAGESCSVKRQEFLACLSRLQSDAD